MLLFIQIGLRESDLRESMFTGFLFPKFPSTAKDTFNENRKRVFEQNKASNEASNEASSEASNELVATSLAEQQAMLGEGSNPVNI